MQTITGSSTFPFSAILYACIVVSSASCALSAYNCIQPWSLALTESEWSFHILSGALRERLATAITAGRRNPEIIGRISNISASPWEAVAVKLLAPHKMLPIIALAALCSDSTWIISAFISPLLTNSLNLSGISVLGVIGYMGMTSTLHNFTASAIAAAALSIFFISAHLLYPFNICGIAL